MESRLTICPEGNATQKEVYSDFESIKKNLASAGIGYERWIAEQPLAADASPEEVAKAYKASIDKIMQQGYKTFDVVSLHADAPQAAEARKKFIDEHTHGLAIMSFWFLASMST